VVLATIQAASRLVANDQNILPEPRLAIRKSRGRHPWIVRALKYVLRGDA